jgi:hypothetical protein
MKSSFLDTLRAGPPPPNVALLPDGLFFTRAVPVAAGATAGAAAAQVELALEAISPFPLAQLYYGWFWAPGAEHAFVFASYRRRFTQDQSASWADTELVLPAFAALFGGEVKPSTTYILGSPEGLTAVHWDIGPVPAKVLFHPITPPVDDASPEDLAKANEERARIREELIRAVGGSRTVVDLAAFPAADPAHSDREIVFRSGDFVSRLPAAIAAALDVRGKDDLAALRRARRRDVILWRVAMGCAAAFILLLVGEFALIGGKAWQKVRVVQVNGQQPRVEKILEAQANASRITDLATKRLLPMEMVTRLVGVNGELLPAGILFTRARTVPASGIYTLVVEATTNNSSQVSAYQSTLENLHIFENVYTQITKTIGDTATFTLTVTFKPGVVKPSTSA